MKKKVLVVVLIMCLCLLFTCTQLIAKDKEQMVPSSEMGFLVRILPGGKIVHAVNWDGSHVKYADERRDIKNARLAFYEKPGEPTLYLRKKDGKWQKTPWSEPPGGGPIEDGIMVHLNAKGEVLNITNMDGSEVKGIDYDKVRVATDNACCYGSCGGYLCCLCIWCPGGHC